MKLQSALDLAAKGFRVFPIAANSKKPPAGLHWKEAATTDPATVAGWWTENPDYNIGIACGGGLLVVDVDAAKGRRGLDSLAMLDMLGLPTSFTVATPSGGKHIYLRTGNTHANRVDTIDNYPGIDIRCEGGYVLGPGSTIDGKSYNAEGAETGIPASPAWFEDILLAHRPQNTPKSTEPLVELDRPEALARAAHWLTHNAPEAVEGAGGDETTYRVAARCRDFGLSEQAALDLMLEHWNERQSPPWQPDDLARKVENAFSYATGGWGAHSAIAEFGDVEIDVGASPFAEAVPAAKERGPEKPPRLVRASSFAPLEKPERQFFVKDLIPHKNVTTLNGDGATGKSLLAMQLAIASASGTRWLGQPVLKAGPVLFFSAEDDEDETHIRVKEICAAERLAPESLDDLHIALMAGEDALLAVENGSQSVLVRTKLFKRLRGWLDDIRPTLLVLDNLADIFGGNENTKSLARQFIGMLRGLAIEFECAVLLLAHPSLSGMASGSGSSGNVAWNNSVRSRLYLQRDKDSEGVEIDPNRRFLETKKANYAGIGTQIDMRWEAGRFVADGPPDMSELDGMETPEDKTARAQRVFLKMVERFNREGRAISPSKGANYAPTLFAEHPRHEGVQKRFFEIAMNLLLEQGAIVVEMIGPPSRQQKNITLARETSD